VYLNLLSEFEVISISICLTSCSQSGAVIRLFSTSVAKNGCACEYL
jgi:hypothetical protein